MAKAKTKAVEVTAIKCVKDEGGETSVVVNYPSGRSWAVKSFKDPGQAKEFRKALLRFAERVVLEAGKKQRGGKK